MAKKITGKEKERYRQDVEQQRGISRNGMVAVQEGLHMILVLTLQLQKGILQTHVARGGASIHGSRWEDSTALTQ